MSSDNGSTHHGITFWGLLQVMFIGLKLTGHIDWPWALVLAPLIANALLISACLMVLFLCYLFKA